MPAAICIDNTPTARAGEVAAAAWRRALRLEATYKKLDMFGICGCADRKRLYFGECAALVAERISTVRLFNDYNDCVRIGVLCKETF